MSEEAKIVYVVRDDQAGAISGIYSTREKAEFALNTLSIPEWYEVVEWKVDA